MPALLNLSLVKAILGNILRCEDAPIWHATSDICTFPLHSSPMTSMIGCARGIFGGCVRGLSGSTYIAGMNLLYVVLIET